MAVSALTEFIKSLEEHARAGSSLTLLAREVATFAKNFLGCDEVMVSCNARGSVILVADEAHSHQTKREISSPFNYQEGEVQFRGKEISLPFFLNEIEGSNFDQPLLEELLRRGYRSLGLVPIVLEEELVGWIECHYLSKTFRWRKQEIFPLFEISESFSRALQLLPKEEAEAKGPTSTTQYERLVQEGNILILRTDSELRIQDVIGDTLRLIGVAREEVLHRRSIWSSLLQKEDIRRLTKRLRENLEADGIIEEEISLRHDEKEDARTFLVRGVPVRDSKKVFLGWEALLLDITERREVERELAAERSRLQALYHVSRVVELYDSPELVALHGLRVLIKTTQAHAGFVAFSDPETSLPQISAAEGFTSKFLQALEDRIQKSGVVRNAIIKGEAALIEDFRTDERVVGGIAQFEGFLSGIVVPLSVEQDVLGAVVLYSRKQSAFSRDDLNLVEVATSQISLAALRAEIYAEEKNQAESLSALYRLSHQIAKHLHPRDIATHAFPVMNEELPSKRMWLGVMNEAGTHIVGQTGAGPGVRAALQQVQIELQLTHEFLDEALETRQAVIVPKGTPMECSLLNRIIEDLKINTLVILPLIALGQIIGVVLLEPNDWSLESIRKRLPLLKSMSGEIANVLLARRFEAKVAEAEKMRAAGLLASGVAHNFNNLLQTVMGQASLIEMQMPKLSPAARSARTIVETVHRGATLIQHLLAFSSIEDESRAPVDIQGMLLDSQELYQSALGVTPFEIDIKTSGEVLGNFGQLQQVLTNLLMNAKEAIGSTPEGRIRVTGEKARLRSNEVHPELPPGVYMRIEVADNGVGMNEDERKRCFEPFFTTKGADNSTGVGVSGSGLGLSSAYSIVKNHGGIITVESSPGTGSRFSVYLPVIDTLAKEELTQDEELRAVPDVLLMNLSPNDIELVQSEFLAVGFRSLASNRWKRAFDFARIGSGVLRLAILDVDQVNFNVQEFVSSLKNGSDALKVILLCKNPDEYQALRDLPEIDFIQKPLSVDSIQSMARKLFLARQSIGLSQRVEVSSELGSSTDIISSEGKHTTQTITDKL